MKKVVIFLIFALVFTFNLCVVGIPADILLISRQHTGSYYINVCGPLPEYNIILQIIVNNIETDISVETENNGVETNEEKVDESVDAPLW